MKFNLARMEQAYILGTIHSATGLCVSECMLVWVYVHVCVGVNVCFEVDKVRNNIIFFPSLT